MEHFSNKNDFMWASMVRSRAIIDIMKISSEKRRIIHRPHSIGNPQCSRPGFDDEMTCFLLYEVNGFRVFRTSPVIFFAYRSVGINRSSKTLPTHRKEAVQILDYPGIGSNDGVFCERTVAKIRICDTLGV